MEASYGSSSSSRRRNVGEYTDRLCNYGNHLKLCTSWTNQNPGRRYLVCSNERGIQQCSFFEWFDPPMCSRSKMIIPGLLKGINRNEQEIGRLTRQLEENRAARLQPAKKNIYIGFLLLVAILLIFIGIVFVYIDKTLGPMKMRMLSYNYY